MKTSKLRKAKSKPAHQPVPSWPNEHTDNQGVSVISALQEFIQDSKTFRMPSRHSVLQWHFKEHCVNAVAVGFCATVSFVLDGVPHQVDGEWKNSKSLAKRDAAERTLGLYVSQWGCHILQESEETNSEPSLGSGDPLWKSKCTACSNPKETLMKFCADFPPCQHTLPKFITSQENNSCKGFVEISLFGVPHTFAGVACEDDDKACSDVARRVLWYLQCSDFADAFDVDMDALVSHSQEFTPPPSLSVVDDDSDS